MPLYFFDSHDDEQTFLDEEGSELADFDAARTAAMRLLPEIASIEVPIDGDRRTFTVAVTDENGKPVYTATLTYAGFKPLR